MKLWDWANIPMHPFCDLCNAPANYKSDSPSKRSGLNINKKERKGSTFTHKDVLASAAEVPDDGSVVDCCAEFHLLFFFDVLQFPKMAVL